AVRSRVHEVHLHGVVEPVERVLRWRVEVELEKSPRRAVDLDRVALVDVGLDRVAVVHEMQARHPVPEGEIWEVLRLDGSWRLRPEGDGRLPVAQAASPGSEPHSAGPAVSGVVA